MPMFGPFDGFVGSFTFAQLKAVTGMQNGAVAFNTSYPPNKGSYWVYSSSVGDWFPMAPCRVYEKTTVTDGILQLADQLLLAIPCEANLLANKVFRLLVSYGKDGTTDASGTFTFRMGANGTTADTAISSAAGTLLAANRSVGFEIWSRMETVTSLVKLGGSGTAAWVATGSSSVLNAATVVANVTTQTTYLTFTTTMPGTTNKPQIGYVALDIQP